MTLHRGVLVVGLVVAIMLFRTGPLGQLHLLYTPAAIVIAQAVIATPVNKFTFSLFTKPEIKTP